MPAVRWLSRMPCRMHTSTVKTRRHYDKSVASSCVQHNCSLQATVSILLSLRSGATPTSHTGKSCRNVRITRLSHTAADFFCSTFICRIAISQNTSRKPTTAEHICHLHNVRIEWNIPFKMQGCAARLLGLADAATALGDTHRKQSLLADLTCFL